MYLSTVAVSSVSLGFGGKESEKKCYRNDNRENENEIVERQQKFSYIYIFTSKIGSKSICCLPSNTK